MKNSGLTKEQRPQLSEVLKAGTSQKETARILEVHQSTICREHKKYTHQWKFIGLNQPDLAQRIKHQRQIDRYRKMKFKSVHKTRRKTI